MGSSGASLTLVLGRAGLARVVGIALVAAACGDPKPEGPDAGLSAVPAPGFGDGPVADRVVMSLFDQIATCEIEHRGLLVDLGTELAAGRVAQRAEEAPALETVEHHGANWSVVSARTLDVNITLAEPTRLFVAANLQPIGAKNVAFFIDDQPMGGVRLKPGSDPRIVSTNATELPFDAGEHTLSVRFSPAKVKGAYAHVDWIRVGFPDEIRATYGPPTLSDVLQADAALGRIPHRALRLKAPSVVRCPLRVPKGARLRSALGLLGGKEGTAEIAVRIDGQPPTLLLQKALTGGDDAKWEDVDVDLDPYAGKLVHLELRTAGGANPGRVLFGDPEVLVSTVEPEDTKSAQVVVLFVMAGIDRPELPGYADKPVPHLERLSRFAETAALFQRHRGSSSVVTGNVATMLTGLPPGAHGVVDYGSSLPQKVPTVARRASDAAVQTALFTGVPHTFAPSGLARGMTKHVVVSPVEGEARQEIAEATAWLHETLAASPNAKIFLVVHARGGHPPWNVSAKQLDVLPPQNYTGDIQPRRAAQQLAMLRRKSAAADLSEQDMIRIGAFYELALVEMDTAFGGLLDALDTANLEDRALIVVTADLASGLTTLFADSPAFDERTLELPLYVRFPKGQAAGRKVDSATGPEDVAATIANALGLPAPNKVWGRDLAHVASGAALAGDGPRFALFSDAYSVRWDSLVLRERRTSRGTVCDLSVDLSCAFDRRPLVPFASSAMTRALASYEEAVDAAAVERQPLVIDDPTLAALKVWGAME